MRILMVSQTYFPYVVGGGPSFKVRGIARALTQRGHQVTVITVQMGREIPAEDTRNADATDRSIEVVYLRTWARYRAITLNPALLSFCLRRLKEFDIAHVYGLYDLLGPITTWFCKKWHIPYVIEPIGMYRPIDRSILKKRLYHKLLGRAMVRSASRIIPTSEKERLELVEDGLQNNQITVRRNGVDLNEFERLPDRGAFRAAIGMGDELLVLFLGRLAFIKGLDLLVHAFSGINDRAKLVIAGPDYGDGCLDEILSLKSQLHQNEKIYIIGPVQGIERLQAFADADVVVIPSRYESFGNTAAEAIVCGVPVIATDRCGIAPLVKDRAGLVVPYELHYLREALTTMISNRCLRERFRANTKNLRPELSWEEPISRMEEIYAEILEPVADVQVCSTD